MAGTTTVVFETHAWSEDNDQGVATGWRPGRLSARGRELAAELGARRRDDGLDAVFSSDLERAVETTRIAFVNSPVPIFLDWRLRECDYGRLNGALAEQMAREKVSRLREPYPGGESWEQAIARVHSFLLDVCARWAGRRVLVVGHVATRWALDHFVNGVDLEELITADFGWREGWEYRIPDWTIGLRDVLVAVAFAPGAKLREQRFEAAADLGQGVSTLGGTWGYTSYTPARRP